MKTFEQIARTYNLDAHTPESLTDGDLRILKTRKQNFEALGPETLSDEHKELFTAIITILDIYNANHQVDSLPQRPTHESEKKVDILTQAVEENIFAAIKLIVRYSSAQSPQEVKNILLNIFSNMEENGRLWDVIEEEWQSQ